MRLIQWVRSLLRIQANRMTSITTVLDQRSWYKELDKWQERGVPILRDVRCYFSSQDGIEQLNVKDWLCWHDAIRIQSILRKGEEFYVADTTRDGNDCGNIVLIVTAFEIAVNYELIQGNESFLAHAQFELAGGKFSNSDFLGWHVAPLMRQGRM